MPPIKTPKKLLMGALASGLLLSLAACVVAPPQQQPEVVYRYEPTPAPQAQQVVETEVVMDRATEPPPPLPVYDQPECPAPGYIWTPGYWAYAPAGYYWVPGTWVMPPRPAVLWTPGYWGWSGAVFLFHAGYWGPHVGFYGGVNYGFGYGGAGYEGGRWEGNDFHYNTAVNNVNVTNIHNTYNVTVVNNITVNKVSYNGGNGGLAVQPTAHEQAAMQEQHLQATAEQMQHRQAASSNRALFASENHGAPAIAATPRPGAFNDRAAISAQGSLGRSVGEPRPFDQQRPEEGAVQQPRTEGARSNLGEVERAPQTQPPAQKPPQPLAQKPQQPPAQKLQVQKPPAQKPPVQKPQAQPPRRNGPPPNGQAHPHPEKQEAGHEHEHERGP